VLKGQELITSARVRNLITQQDGIKAAYFGFLDRFRALPGDYDQAFANIANVSAAGCNSGNGNGNGRIETGGASNENVLVWEHLSKAGFINGSYTCAATETAATTPNNAFAVKMQLIWDNVYEPAASTARHNLKTGGQIASDLLAEVDRKIDDGSATGGTFRFSPYDGGAGVPDRTKCFNTTTAPNAWKSDVPEANCGAATLF
jgi:hypothetical protein